MSMFKDIVWDAKGNDEVCLNNSKTIEEYAERFLRGHWCLSQGLDLKRIGTELTIANQMDLGIELQRKCCRISQDLVIRYSVVPVPWRGEIRSKEGGTTSIHLNGSTQNIEFLLQMVISVNQLSLHGAVADMIEASGKTVASGQLEKQEILTQLPLAEVPADEERQGNLLQEYEQRFEKLSDDEKLTRLCSGAGLRLVEVGQIFCALPSPR